MRQAKIIDRGVGYLKLNRRRKIINGGINVVIVLTNNRKANQLTNVAVNKWRA